MDILLSWSEFKAIVTAKELLVQYYDYGLTKTYKIWAMENSCVFNVEIPHTTSPAPGSDEEDFVDNYMTDANQCVMIKTDPKVRVSQPVHEVNIFSTDQNKINYSVPADKVLFIQHLNITGLGDGIIVTEWQADGVPFNFTSLLKSGTGTATLSLPEKNPHGPFAANVVIRCSRVAGDSGKDWAAILVGYLEDA